MQRDLVAEEVEIDPGLGTAAFGAAQDAAIETASCIEIPDVKGKMEDAMHSFGLWAAVL
jgi:hypothetical protein